jgi:hypothetical protein
VLRVHPDEVVEAALTLRRGGAHATEIARRLAVPKSTVQFWCRGGRRNPRARGPDHACPRCGSSRLDEEQYAYLLGAYLGDGYINIPRGSVPTLAISCADDWPGVRREIEHAVRAVIPTAAVRLRARAGCHDVMSCTKHWLCLLPQHGPGMKHTRAIVLAPWQQSIADLHPGLLLRGLIHSDGCRITNWATKTTSSGTKRYEYPRYFFSNKSLDILDICTDALDRLAIAHRRPRRDMISVAKRDAVARLDEFVGPKY